MTLTVVVGSSGSGKTTFLEDVNKINSGVYVRQYHMLRPYIHVSKIPNFSTAKLPYWTLYSDKTSSDGKKNASYNPHIKIGGTMAGEFVPGLSGGQRKILIFELVKQRTSNATNLLLVFDEPFAGVTDDFVPFITQSLEEMRTKHMVLLVTNDHVDTLAKMADATITVSAVDRGTVKVNGKQFGRETALHAVSVGNSFVALSSVSDFRFFLETEVLFSPDLKGVLAFTTVALALFFATFWESRAGSEALSLVALGLIGFLALNPYLISLPDWRSTVIEESYVLMHTSVQMSMALKALLCLALFLLINSVAFGLLTLCIDTNCSPDPSGFSLCGANLWLAIIFDDWSLTLPFVCFGLYTKLPLQVVNIIAAMPFLLMIFFSTTFSPGAGIAGLKALRYIFSRFYLWCGVPIVKERMEGCPSEEALIGYLALTANLIGLLFIAFQLFRVTVMANRKTSLVKGRRAIIAETNEFRELQKELKNEKHSQLHAAQAI